jgi:hypothetical protein
MNLPPKMSRQHTYVCMQLIWHSSHGGEFLHPRPPPPHLLLCGILGE